MKSKLFFIASAILYFSSFGKSYSDDLMLDKFKTNIKPGNTYQEVVKYLDEQKIEYSDHKDNKDISAILRETKKNIAISENWEIKILFDDNQQVKDVEYKPVYTGL